MDNISLGQNGLHKKNFLQAILIFCLVIPISASNAFPCIAFCGGGKVFNTGFIGDLVDEYIAAPSIDHLDGTLKKRSEEAVELARKTLDKLLSEKITDLDLLAKSNIELAAQRLQDVSEQSIGDLRNVLSDAIENISSALYKQQSLLSVILLESSVWLSTALTSVAISSALMVILVKYLLKRKKLKDPFDWKGYLTTSGIVFCFGVLLLVFASSLLGLVMQKSGEKKLAHALEDRNLVEALFYARQISSLNGDPHYHNNARRIELVQDIVFRPLRPEKKVIKQQIKDANSLIKDVWEKEKILDRATLSLVPFLLWPNRDSRISEYISVQLAALSINKDKKQITPIEDTFNASMKAIIRNYLMTPLSEDEIKSGSEEWHAAESNYPFKIAPLSNSELLQLSSDFKGSTSSSVRFLSIKSMNTYFYAVDNLMRRRAGLPQANVDQIRWALSTALEDWENYLNSPQYMNSSTTEKLYLLKSPISILARLLDYEKYVDSAPIPRPAPSCIKYDSKDDKRPDIEKISDASLRTISGILPGIQSLDEAIAKITAVLELGAQDNEALPPKTLLALRTTVKASLIQSVSSLYRMEYDLLTSASNEGAEITDCLQALPKEVPCGKVIAPNYYSLPCTSNLPNVQTSICMKTLWGVSGELGQMPIPCPDTSKIKLSLRELSESQYKAIKGAAEIGLFTCENKDLATPAKISGCQESGYKKPAYKVLMERYFNEPDGTDFDRLFSKANLLPTS
ncbi:hypothetical protein [Pseudomonas monteilii]|uniref:hypothetical protein n=1 Tax=Pseudomonas monteilii TaxID=76759 RepID=UPI0011C35EDB|nr:hypothetical protein [Pseudomonas monteilii]